MRGDITTGEATLHRRCAATGEGHTKLSALQVTQESACLVGPSPIDLRAEYDEPGSATFTRQFWVCALFPSPGLGKGHAIVPVCSRMGCPVANQG